MKSARHDFQRTCHSVVAEPFGILAVLVYRLMHPHAGAAAQRHHCDVPRTAHTTQRQGCPGNPKRSGRHFQTLAGQDPSDPTDPTKVRVEVLDRGRHRSDAMAQPSCVLGYGRVTDRGSAAPLVPTKAGRVRIVTFGPDDCEGITAPVARPRSSRRAHAGTARSSSSTVYASNRLVSYHQSTCTRPSVRYTRSSSAWPSPGGVS